jgi:hypothetical protein
MITSIEDFNILSEETKKQILSICSDEEIACSMYFADEKDVSQLKSLVTPYRLRKIRQNLLNIQDEEACQIDYSIFLIKTDNLVRKLEEN